MTPLTELDPRWFPGDGLGVRFLCPIHQDHWIGVLFANPVGGREPSDTMPNHWQREGDTFEALTLTPSLDVPDHWHGTITAGEVVP